MKPPPFEYAAPESVDDVMGLLADDPDDVSLLAGGQSLMPALNMRLAQPRLVVDLNGVHGLDGIEPTATGLRLGAIVRQRTLETDPRVREAVPLLTEAAHHIAHLPIRTRGTVGGSLAHADPAAELPATVAVLDGRLVVRGGDGVRTVPAAEFFVAPLTSALEPGELLVALEVEAPPPGTGWAFLEVARTHGAFALVAAAALVRTNGDGLIDVIRVALAGVGGTPYVPAWLDEMALGEAAGADLFRRIGERVVDDAEPLADIHATAEYRRRVAGTIAARALSTAATRIGGASAA